MKEIKPRARLADWLFGAGFLVCICLLGLEVVHISRPVLRPDPPHISAPSMGSWTISGNPLQIDAAGVLKVQPAVESIVVKFGVVGTQ